MTAQRTTLLSLCLVQYALIFNGHGLKDITLLTTNVKVSYHYALYTLAGLILFNGVSYIWRWFAEPQLGQEGTIIDKLDDLKRKAERTLENINQLGSPDDLSSRLRTAMDHKEKELLQELGEALGQATIHAEATKKSHSEIESLLYRKIKYGFLRDLIFDVVIIGIVATGALVLTFFAPIKLG